ncbi:MAG: T9SS type A sorting domain-containing protein [Bacteroidia bacterium]|nr:T9SS type A sorting domain-containing protein [Bacteroidia bacterium]
MKKKCILLTLLLWAGLSSGLYAQNWVEMMKDPDVNFYDVQKAFNRYYVKKDRQIERQKRRMSKRANEGVHEEEIEVPGFAQYKRWEWFMAPRVSQNGERFDPATPYREYEKYRQQLGTANAGNWTLIGPTTSIPTGGGAGRLNFVRFDPTDPNIIYVGSPAGGLWKSTNGGLNWSTNTDQLSQVIGCTDIAIDPTNTNVMYLATGDGDGGDTYTVGILKSTDGGLSWNTTGLSYFMANTRQISRLLIDPNNTSTLLAATSAGIFRSTDAGATFSLVQPGSFKDMEFKPGDPATVYTAGTEFFRSTNNGQTWTKITTGLATSANVGRMAIAVSPHDASYVYVLAAKPATDYGFEGIYRSTNSGLSFVKVTTSSPANVLGWNSNGGDTGGQGWYDLAIAASPVNKDEIIVGGVNIWRSTNGGSSFTLNGHWTGSGAPYVHADVHDLVYTSGTTYFAGCDGGIFKTTNGGSSWTDLSDGLQIGQMYGFGQSTSNPSLLLQGWQDNGTNRYNGGWQQVMGGDGMLCFIDWNNDQNMWGSQYEGSLNRSTNGGASWSPATGGINETGAWVTPWSQDPVTAGTIYSGFVNLWKSTNGGVSWTKISNFSNASNMTTFTVSPADNQVIWVSKPGGFYKTSNGGATWSTISNVPPGTITGIACHNSDPNKAWITYSGFNNSNKVFQTTDQGLSWTNLSGSIPNIPINCIAYENNSNDGLYIGTDVGAFYKDAGMSVWQPFSNGLPHVIVSQLSIHYASGKIRASTYGRGMWESGLYVPGSYPPTSAFGSSLQISCPGSAVQFNDYSAGQPTSWNWSFPGGNPSTSTQQNPLVVYNSAGTYPVTLITANANGIDTTTTLNYISIASSSQADPVTSGDVRCGPGPVNLSATGSGTGTLRWWDAPGGGNLLNTGSSYSPSINGTTTFYVDEELPPGITDYTGEAFTGIGAGAYFTANDIRGLYFDVLNPILLQSVEVYSNSAGNRTIEIIDAMGNTYADTTIFIPASPSNPVTVNVNFTIYPGNNYFIKCRGLVDLYRNSAGATYPYTSTSVNITGSNAGTPGYYYFFYFWTYQEIACNTGRSACVALDTCSTQGLPDLFSANALDVYPNPSTGVFSLEFNATVPDDYQVLISNAIGEKVFAYTLQDFAGEHRRSIDLSHLSKGLYLIQVSNGEKSISRKLNVH